MSRLRKRAKRFLVRHAPFINGAMVTIGTTATVITTAGLLATGNFLIAGAIAAWSVMSVTMSSITIHRAVVA